MKKSDKPHIMTINSDKLPVMTINSDKPPVVPINSDKPPVVPINSDKPPVVPITSEKPPVWKKKVTVQILYLSVYLCCARCVFCVLFYTPNHLFVSLFLFLQI